MFPNLALLLQAQDQSAFYDSVLFTGQALKLALCHLSDSMAVTNTTLSMKVLNKTYFFFCAIFIP